MTENNDIKLTHSPDKLLVKFTQTGFLKCLLIAVAAHVIIVMLFSLSYIRDQINPERAERRQAEKLETQQAAEQKENASAPAQTQEVTSAAATSEEEQKPSEQPPSSEDSRTNALIMKQITELPKPEEMPEVPDDLGISIFDTNLD